MNRKSRSIILRGWHAPLAPPSRHAAEVYDDTLRPKPSVILQRFRFNSCNREEGESVADFVMGLHRLSIDCAFGDTLSDTLRDRRGVRKRRFSGDSCKKSTRRPADCSSDGNSYEEFTRNAKRWSCINSKSSTSNQAPVAVHQTSSRRDLRGVGSKLEVVGPNARY